MGKNAWITYICVSIVLITMALVFMFILIPQISSDTFSTDANYQNVNKLDYTYSQTKQDTQIEKQYTITENQITTGIKDKNYVPGKSNPFEAVNIYAEAGGGTNTGNNDNNGGTKVPEQK